MKIGIDSAARLAAALLLSHLVVGCSGGGGGAPDAGTPDGGLPSAESTIGTAGGTIELTGIGGVVIPAGALDADKSIRVAVADRGRLPATPDRTRTAGEALSLTPHGTAFDAPVRVRIDTEPTANRVRVYRLSDDADRSWKLVRGETTSPDRTRVEVRVDKFSVYSVFEAEMPSDCGPFDDDGDGVYDFCDVCDAGDDNLDTDLDGVPDACDPCPDPSRANGVNPGDCVYEVQAFADTYGDEGMATTPFGDSTVIEVSAGPPAQVGHLSFGVPFDTCSFSVASARLRVPMNSVSMGVGETIDVHQRDGMWDEVSATWDADLMTYAQLLESVPVADIDAAGELVAESASFSQAVTNEGALNCGLFNFALATTGGSAQFASSEDMVATPASLSVTASPFWVHTVLPTDDAHVDPAQLTMNFGDQPEMVAGADGAPDTNVRHIYMKFDISTLQLPICLTIEEVSLEMTVAGGELYGASDGTIQATEVIDDTWMEGAITAGSPPALGATSFPLWRVRRPDRGDDQSRRYHNDQLRMLVESHFSDGFLGLQLEITDGWHSYYSKEALIDALRPRLHVLYTNAGPC